MSIVEVNLRFAKPEDKSVVAGIIAEDNGVVTKKKIVVSIEGCRRLNEIINLYSQEYFIPIDYARNGIRFRLNPLNKLEASVGDKLLEVSRRYKSN